MDDLEREKLLAVPSIGPTMVRYFAAIGMARLSDFAGGDAAEIAMRIDIHLGARRMNALGIRAIENVIAAAAKEADHD